MAFVFCFLMFKCPKFLCAVPTYSDEQQNIKDEWRRCVNEWKMVKKLLNNYLIGE